MAPPAFAFGASTSTSALSKGRPLSARTGGADENAPPGNAGRSDSRGRTRPGSARGLRSARSTTSLDKSKSREPSPSAAEAAAAAAAKREEEALAAEVAAAVLAAREALARGDVELSPVVESLLGDPEAVRPLLRARPATTKFDYKNNAAKLQEHVKALRTALGRQIARRTALRGALAEVQESVRTQLSERAEEIDASREALRTATLSFEQQAFDSENRWQEKLDAALQVQQEDRANFERREGDLLATLDQRNRELVEERAKLAAVREELSGTRASLAAKTEQAETLAREKAELEVKFHSYKEHHGTTSEHQMQAIAELKVMVGNVTDQLNASQKEVAVKDSGIVQSQGEIEALRAQLRDEERRRREMHNALQELKGNIRVFCRSRPALEEEESALRAGEAGGVMSLGHNGESYDFSYDKVFGAQSTQQEIFEEVSGLVQSALDGYKVCIFAYGQTGSGKTFTMQGGSDPSSWGLIPRSLTQILRSVEAMRGKGWEWSLRASFMEVYNETLRDLLEDKAADAPALGHTIVHDDCWGAMVTNVASVPVESMEQIKSVMARAARQRSVGSTDMNAVSSRSHAIFALYLRGTNAEADTELRGALHLVDLAGSERLDKSCAVGGRLRETQNINRSLSSLADVFAAKAEEGRAHVPFRNSKLTHLMEPCLSGHGKTLMVVNVAPERSHSHETLCSLRFASQVSQCNTGGKPKRTVRAAGASTASAASGSSGGSGWLTPSASAPHVGSGASVLRPQTPRVSRPATPTGRGGRQAAGGRPTMPFGC